MGEQHHGIGDSGGASLSAPSQTGHAAWSAHTCRGYVLLVSLRPPCLDCGGRIRWLRQDLSGSLLARDLRQLTMLMVLINTKR